MSSISLKDELGIAPVLKRAEQFLTDHRRMLALLVDLRTSAGEETAGRAVSVIVEPAPAGADGPYTWRSLGQRGNGVVPGARPGPLDAGEVLGKLQELLGQQPSAVSLVLAARTGGEAIELEAGRVRRRILSSLEAESAVAEARRRIGRQGRPGRPDPPSGAPGIHRLETSPVLGKPRQVQALIAPAGGPSASWVNPVVSGRLLDAIGIVGPGGRVRRDQRRKYNQILHLINLLRGMLERLPGERELRVVDCGCGKSQLLFVLNHILTERLGRRVHLTGLDSEPHAIDAARALQHRLGYRNMDFAVSTIRAWPRPGRIDLVLSLHACDTATDEALALGVAARAQGIVSVPCCQQELTDQVANPQLAPILSHSTLRGRFADWLTDGLRALVLEAHGYDVDVVEYVSPLDTPKNILIRAERRATAGESERAARMGEAEAIMRMFGARPSLPRLIETLLTQGR